MKLKSFVLSAVLALAWGSFAVGAGEPGDSVKRYGTWGIDLSGRDLTVRPGDDFAAFAFGTWYRNAVIPADQREVGPYGDLVNQTRAQLRWVIEESARNPTTPDRRLIADLYNAFLDEARIEKLDAEPLAADLAAIRRIADKAAMAELMGRANGSFGLPFFPAAVRSDPKEPAKNMLRLGQGGLGLNGREYYLDEKLKAHKEAYEAYAARTLKMIGWPNAEEAAREIVAMETRIAEASWPQVDRRDVTKTYNVMTLAELEALAPGFPWRTYLKSAGIGAVDKLIALEKSAFPGISAVFAETPLETLKAWEAFQTVDWASPLFSRRFVDSRFAFRGKVVEGLDANRPRWERGVNLVDETLADALGREYAAKFFPPASKAKMEDLVANVKGAMAKRIERLPWMGPQTRAAALEKLAALRVRVGYPESWRDYSGLSFDRGDLYGNVQRAEAFHWAFNVAKLDRPVDKEEWGMPAYAADAFASYSRVLMGFAAGFLQPPFFDPGADPAVNYGAVGAVIGHEIVHFFDDQGRKYDSKGALRDWWTAEDAARFEKAADQLARQFDAYEAVPGVRLNGRQTLGENIADLAGVIVALDAYHASLGGRPALVIDGLTGDQRFFLSWAQNWQAKQRDEFLRRAAIEDVHAPPLQRLLGSVRNVDEWYTSFDVKPGDKYYLEPEERVRIW